MTVMEYVIEINGMSKDYETGFLRKKNVRALDRLDLKVRGGQIFGFLGGNGAGKTTTIKTLMRLQFPTEGSAAILGRDISDITMHRLIGYCPENPYFYDYLTPRELMDHFGRLFGFDKAKRRQRSAELLSKVGLDEKNWNRPLRKFSKGMLQRVALAQSLINDPEIVFLDEPMSGLDPLGRREIRELIAELRDQGKTVFMCTHILTDIEALCDDVAILQKGRLAATGSLSELLQRDKGRRSFEITVQDVDSRAISEQIEFVAGSTLSTKGGSTLIEVQDDTDIEAVLRIVRDAGGHLVSIHSQKQALEDLFVQRPGDVTTSDS